MKIDRICAVGAVVFRDFEWFRRPSTKGSALTVVVGFAIASIVEWMAVYRLRRWTYGPSMPILEPLGVGMFPILQLILLPSLIFFAASRCGKERVVNARPI